MFKIIKLLIVIAGIYIAVLCALPWVKFFIFKNSVSKVLNISRNITNAEIMEYLLEKADETNIPITQKNITIEPQQDGDLYIFEYKSVIGFPVVENKIIFKHEFSKLKNK